jgi:2-polyprenyl-3-methyl-5-hydroxy-6-metoxy-1,4-benzoquinol methylase
MLEAFSEERARTTFDFRAYAHPADPLRHLFEEWVPYYRDKYAICRMIAPRSILEIGVRYGYSAMAFLSACPEASYLGLDNDSDTFGGAHGALDWARRQLAPFDARVETADTQRLASLPGDRYDLVHVDGQQDGEGTLHDLRLALEKAKYILVDGIFWTQQNLDASSHFLRKYRSLIDYAVVLPGYAGDLVVRVRDDAAKAAGAARDHRAIRDEYTREYFLQDCGGYHAFKSGDGRVLADTRLTTVFEAGAPWDGLNVLDVGCGRGELAYACYRAGAKVTGLDYSPAAIDIATSTYSKELGGRLRFVCEDVLDYAPPEPFDRIVAADFVEHIDPATLDRVFATLRRWLAPRGFLVIHTWPNRIAYERRQRAHRKRAAEAGFFVPRNQRSLYEDRMHLNEQTPARLRRALARHFPSCLVWVGGGDNPSAGLLGPVSRAMLAGNDSLYAIASIESVDAQALRGRLSQPALDPASLAGLRLELQDPPPRISHAQVFEMRVRVHNGAGQRLASLPPHPIHLSYHWREGGRVAVFDGLRSRLEAPLAPGESRTVVQRVLAPPRPGTYELDVTLVQEGGFWLDAQGGAFSRVAVVVE